MEYFSNRTDWELVNPEAVVQFDAVSVNEHPRDLNGKTVVLYWNGKPNGDVFLDRLGKLLMEKSSGVNIIKAWDVIPSSKYTDHTLEASRSLADQLAELNPDIVIGAPGD